jgi:radical SAM enzyme (TIGR01210 family)
MPEAGQYPASHAARDRFVLERRSTRPRHDPWRHQGVIVEDERGADGRCVGMATVLLTGRECPWRCTMCDLWTYTTVTDTPVGALPAQLADARLGLRDQGVAVHGMKLYNAGSFFDPRAVPDADYDAIAATLAGLSLVVVESHPALVGPRVDRLLAALAREAGGERPIQLEVAMGLETAHPGALDRLNKRFTLEGFRTASAALADRGITLRVFLLICPPFVPSDEQDDWLMRSIDAAFSCGASAVSLIPTRSGNGAMDALAERSDFVAPDLSRIERSAVLALTHADGRGRVFVDLWDLERFARCARCYAHRRDRLNRMNLSQRVLPEHVCSTVDRKICDDLVAH